MINNMIWVPLEFSYKDENNNGINDKLITAGMYEKFEEAINERESYLISGAVDRGIRHTEFFLENEEMRCNMLLPYLEATADKFIFSVNPDRHFYFNKKFLKGTYIKDIK